MDVALLSCISIIIASISAVIGVLAFARQRGIDKKIIEERLTRLESREDVSKEVDLLRERVRANEVKNELVWNALEKVVVDILKHPNQQKKDVLLEKVLDKSITLKEMEDLKEMLISDLKNNNINNKEETAAATILVARINQQLFDAGQLITVQTPIKLPKPLCW